MSHLALRRVMIRLMHDPAFAAEVYADPARALATVELNAEERAWLTNPPPAAWRTDRARPVRVLAALAEEYPVTVALAPDHAAAFFGSPEFHAAIQERGSLALAFGDHLRAAPDPRARALAPLERAIAEVRRADPGRRGPDHGTVQLAPRAVIVSVPKGALPLLESRHAGRPDAELAPDDEWVLATGPPGGDITLELLDPPLAAVLLRARGGCRRVDLLGEARLQGAEPGEDAELLERLVADGLLAVGYDGSHR